MMIVQAAPLVNTAHNKVSLPLMVSVTLVITVPEEHLYQTLQMASLAIYALRVVTVNTGLREYMNVHRVHIIQILRVNLELIV